MVNLMFDPEKAQRDALDGMDRDRDANHPFSNPIIGILVAVGVVFVFFVLMLHAFARDLDGPLKPMYATWKPEYSSLSEALRIWFETRELTPEAQTRLHFTGCCRSADRFKTKFHVTRGSGADEWYYCADAGIENCPDDRWKLIPSDVIHDELIEPTPGHEGEDSEGFAQLRADGILFLHPAGIGYPTCFWPPQSGQ